jgi:hypothetical protein
MGKKSRHAIRGCNRAALVLPAPAAVLMQQPAFARVIIVVIGQHLRQHRCIPQRKVEALCTDRVNGVGRVAQDDQAFADILLCTRKL